jgi:uroporphyrin-3 C-methyltransferase
MTDEVTRAQADAATDADAPMVRQSRGPWLIALVLLLVAAGLGYYWVAFIERPQADALATRIDALESMLAAVDAQLEDGAARDEEARATRQASASRLGELDQAQADLAGALKGLYAKESQSTLAVVLAEVEYLVFAASQRLILERDVVTAAAALKSADLRLRAAQHPDLIALREQLGRDIAALEAVTRPDIEGLAIYLANTVTLVDNLKTKPIADLDMSFTSMGAETVSTDNWQGVAQALWTDLKSLVEIKDGELEDGVLFDPELRYFLQQNLRLELASARLAVLRRDTANFRAAVTLSVNLLETYYAIEDGDVSAIIARLNEHRSLELAPPVPTISGSLDAVRVKREEIRAAAVARAGS